MENGRVGVPSRVVDLVGEHDHRPLGGAKDHGELLVAGRYPRPRVDDEQHEVGLVDRRARLFGDLRSERATVGFVDPAGVDQPEPGARPFAEQLLAVPGDAGRLVHDRCAGLGEPVDQRRLTDVREAHDRNGAGELAGRLDLLLERDVVVAHRGGTASGRPSPCISTRKSKSSRIFACRMADASL